MGIMSTEGGTGSSPVYDPSAPSGPATNRGTQMAQQYGAPGKSSTALWVGSGKSRRPTTAPTGGRSIDGMSGREEFQSGAYSTASREDIFLTPVQLLSAFDQFDRKDYLKFKNLLVAAGLTSEAADAMSVRGAYQQLIYEAIDMQAGGIKVSPMQLVKNLIRKNGLDPSKIGSDEKFSVADAMKPQSQVTTSVYDLTPEDARTTLEQAIQQKLGRAPTEEELEDFITAAQTEAAANPTVQRTRVIPGAADVSGDQVSVQREGGEAVATTVTNTTQGFGAEDVARMAVNRAENAPDYASYQAVSQYFPALVQAFESTI